MLIADIGTNDAALITLLIVTIAGFIKQWLDKRDTNTKLKTVEVAVADVPKIAENVQILEKSMNGMKEAQVDLSKQIGLLEGEKKGRADKTAEVKADAKDAENSPPTGAVTAIIEAYKADELKKDIAAVPEKVVEAIDEKKAK